MILDSLAEVKEDLKHVKTTQTQHKEEVQKIEITMAKMCESIEYHIKRTDLLEEMVEPLHTERIENEAISKYKKKKREDLMYKLKLPVAIVAALGAIGALINWFMGS